MPPVSAEESPFREERAPNGIRKTRKRHVQERTRYTTLHYSTPPAPKSPARSASSVSPRPKGLDNFDDKKPAQSAAKNDGSGAAPLEPQALLRTTAPHAHDNLHAAVQLIIEEAAAGYYEGMRGPLLRDAIRFETSWDDAMGALHHPYDQREWWEG
jgi:hypothetical protein